MLQYYLFDKAMECLVINEKKTNEFVVSKIIFPDKTKIISPIKKERWMLGDILTDAGKIPLIKTVLDKKDNIEHRQIRWNNKKRMNYSVSPGLYGVGNPVKDSPVFVSANYKLSFDILRESLKNFNAWVLVLETKGINVWCAAGKGSFGTKELNYRIKSVALEKIVSHKKIIVPQLGAPGIAAHLVKKETGFKVIYGPVRAADIPKYVENNFIKTEEMKKVTFPVNERMKLVPMELVPALKYVPHIAFVLLILNVFGSAPMLTETLLEIGLLLISIIIGTALTPMLLPYIPFRSFAAKGWILGIVSILPLIYIFEKGFTLVIIYLLLFPPLSSYLALNFTGSSTYTNLSGVVKEMKYSLPLMIVSIVLGIVLKIYILF